MIEIPKADGNPGLTPHGGDAFFDGSGGDRGLLGSLRAVGWQIAGWRASCHWRAWHPDTCDQIEYIEGDVYRRNPEES